MKCWLQSWGRLLAAAMATTGILFTCLLIANPEGVGTQDWLKNGWRRITGQSVEVRTRAKSKRCAQNIASAYAAARAAGVTFGSERLSNNEFPGPLLESMNQIAGEHRSASAFGDHRPAAAEQPAGVGERTSFFINVFTNFAAKEALMHGAAEFPAGSVILKRKSSGRDGKGTEYYTGMRKNWQGYWPEMGDWEFFVLNDGGKEIEAGRLKTCANCHEQWPGTDFVSRNYFDPGVPGGFKTVIDDETEKQAR